MKKLFAKFKVNGPSTFFQGALASAAATFVGHYPWFFVYNYMNAALPKYDETWKKLSRSAVIGFCASAISDTFSNSIRVIKVYKQANVEAITYPEALKRWDFFLFVFLFFGEEFWQVQIYYYFSFLVLSSIIIFLLLICLIQF